MSEQADPLELLLQEHTPYDVDKKNKKQLFEKEIKRLSQRHISHCSGYRDILKAYRIEDIEPIQASQIPALPVRLFKLTDLKSVADEKVIKVLTSSGTTSQVVSRIYLDRETSVLQTKVLVNIMQSYLGKARLPMLIVDHSGVIKDRKSFSARGAGILGLSNFGRAHTYLLDDEMNINFSLLDTFLSKHEGQSVFVFGFTFMVWQYFIEALIKQERKVDIQNSVLIHSGGWKKLQERAIDNGVLKAKIKEYTGIECIHNFYGMVEQVGSVFVECEHGYLHAPNYSDIVIRNAYDWSECSLGEKGIVELHSLLPRSYPGHKLLTEDIGAVVGEDDCACGRKGKYFLIHGRIAKAEMRGCSDTHAASVDSSGE